jgi:lysophospholipase L1-like esterase
MRESASFVLSRRFFAAATVALAIAGASGICAAAYLIVQRPRLGRLGGLRNLSLVRAYLFDPRIRHLAAALQEDDPRSDVFKTMWDTNTGVLLSRRLFREVDMDGVPKYAYKPNVKKLGFTTSVGGLMWRMQTVDTPRMRDALRDLDTTFLMDASYDEHGFRRVAPELTTGCTRRVLFLGDSFTDGLWVQDHETLVSVYGRLARARAGVAVCPVNAGVNGYGSFEERFVLEHEFDEAGRPSVIFVLYFPNDVDQDYDAVVNGRLAGADRAWRDSLSELRRMHHFASGHRSTLVLVAIPTAEQTFHRATQAYYQDVLRAFAAQEGLMFIDLYDPFVARDPHPLYWTWDPHFTPEGHRVAAEVLYERTRGLLQ